MKTGMIVGMVVSVVIVLGLLIALILVNRQAPADAPTQDTAPAKLVKQELPADLPPLFTPTHPDVDSNPVYRKVFAFYDEHRGQMQIAATEQANELATQLANLLIQAMNDGKPVPIYLDKEVPMRPGAAAPFEEGFQAISAFIGDHGKEWLSVGIQGLGKQPGAHDSIHQGTQELLSLFALGQRCFTTGQRYRTRYLGLLAMKQVAEILAAQKDHIPEGKLAVPWVAACQKIQDAWINKQNTLMRIPRQVGDIINIAEHDQDPTFRIEGTLMLGVAKLGGRHANEVAVNEALAKLVKDPNPLVAQAAKDAQGFTAQTFQQPQ